MSGVSFPRRAGVMLALASALAFQAEAAPRLVVIPLSQGEGAPDRAAARFGALLADELKTRDGVELVAPGAGKQASGSARTAKGLPEATAAFEEGKRALGELKFDEAVAAYKKGTDASFADPANADFAGVFDALVSSAVASFRKGDEKGAQAALLTVARLDPSYKLAGTFPPVFLREFEKAKKKAEKQPKGTLAIDGPPGATAYVNGRDLGMVPVEEPVSAGTHYVKVEGARGELFGQAVEVKGGTAKVKGAFASAPLAAAPPELRVGPALDGGDASRVAAYAKAAGADYALVGLVYRSSERQLAVGSALYSVRRQGFVALPQYNFDHEMHTANVEAFKLADDVSQRVASFGAPSALPLTLAAKPARPVVASASEPPPDVPLGPREPVRPSDGRLAPTDDVRAFARKSIVDDGPVSVTPDPPRVEPKKGTSPLVWVGVGVAAAALAGGTYFAVTELGRPVTGKVTMTW